MRTTLMAIEAPLNEDIRATLKDWVPRDPGILILFGALVLVSLVVFIWAAFFRKRSRRPHYEFHQQHHEPLTRRMVEGWKAGALFPGKRHHRRHRKRRRNPTLAEAGGLPPARAEEQPPNST